MQVKLFFVGISHSFNSTQSTIDQDSLTLQRMCKKIIDSCLHLFIQRDEFTIAALESFDGQSRTLGASAHRTK